MSSPPTQSKLDLVNDICTQRGMKIIALERELAALRVYVETFKSIVRTSNIQALRNAKESAENELENVRATARKELKEEKSAQLTLSAMLQTRDGENKHQAAVIKSHEKTMAAMQHDLTKTQSDLQFSNTACELLRAELANEKQEKENLVRMSQVHQAQNAEVIEGMQRVQERLAKYDNALMAKDDAIAQYKEKSEVLQVRCEDALGKVDWLVKEAEKRREEDRMEEVLGITNEDMLEAAGEGMTRLQGEIDRMAWEMEKMRESAEESDRRCRLQQEAHKYTMELAVDKIVRLSATIEDMECELETMREEAVWKSKVSSKVEELEQRIRKMREVFDRIEIEEEAQGALESSESGELEDEDEDELEVVSCSASESEWEQVCETGGECASP